MLQTVVTQRCSERVASVNFDWVRNHFGMSEEKNGTGFAAFKALWKGGGVMDV